MYALEHPSLGAAAPFVVYGMLLMMTLYCTGVARVLHQGVYAAYAAYFAASASYLALRAGGLVRLLLPDHTTLLGYLTALSCAVTCLCAARAFCSAPDLRPLSFGWGSVSLGALISFLPSLGLLPTSPLTTFSLQIGLALQMALFAAALADTINDGRAELRAVNDALSSELSAVSLALRTAEEASQRAERATRVRDEFIATMSHEFRTPLNPIINIPQGLRAEFVRVAHVRCAPCGAIFELESGEKVSSETACPDCARQGMLRQESALSFSGSAARARTLLTKVEHSGEHLLRLVNGILDYSKMEAQQLRLVRERFDACALARELVAELEETARRVDIQLALVCENRPLAIYGDPERIREVLTHLIDNAIKFRRGPSSIVVTVCDEGERLSFSVADQGIGIAPEHIEDVFTSFEQVSKGNTRSHGGTGLGLSMARSLVQMHGGEIRASSELDVGSTFRFWLPKGVPARGSARSLGRLSEGASP